MHTRARVTHCQVAGRLPVVKTGGAHHHRTRSVAATYRRQQHACVCKNVPRYVFYERATVMYTRGGSDTWKKMHFATIEAAICPASRPLAYTSTIVSFPARRVDVANSPTHPPPVPAALRLYTLHCLLAASPAVTTLSFYTIPVLRKLVHHVHRSTIRQARLRHSIAHAMTRTLSYRGNECK